MNVLDKLEFIKDSINNIINMLYGPDKDGIIDIIDWNKPPEVQRWVDDPIYPKIVLFYIQDGKFSTSRIQDDEYDYLRNIIEPLMDIKSGIPGLYMDVDNVYNKILEWNNYSAEELKLYFKLS